MRCTGQAGCAMDGIHRLPVKAVDGVEGTQAMHACGAEVGAHGEGEGTSGAGKILTQGAYVPTGLVVLAMVSVQSGTAMSTWKFDTTGPIGTAFLRLLWAAAFLLLWARPRLRGREPGDLRACSERSARA